MKRILLATALTGALSAPAYAEQWWVIIASKVDGGAQCVTGLSPAKAVEIWGPQTKIIDEGDVVRVSSPPHAVTFYRSEAWCLAAALIDRSDAIEAAKTPEQRKLDPYR
jgi:hypothetical protein